MSISIEVSSNKRNSVCEDPEGIIRFLSRKLAFRAAHRFSRVCMILTFWASGILILSWQSTASSQQSYDTSEKESGGLSILSNPAGFSVTLKGGNTVVGTTPFTVFDLAEGAYRLKISKRGYDTQLGQLMFSKTRRGPLAARFSPDFQTGMLLRSAVLPGWGQSYAGKKAKGIFWTTVQAGAIATAFWEHDRYRKAVAVLRASVKEYEKASSIAEIERFQREADRRLHDADRTYSSRQVTLALASGIWLLNVLDTMLMSSRLRADTSTPGSIILSPVPKTRTKAILRSALFPGWGQFYSRRRTAGILYALSGLSSATALVLANSDYQKKIDRLQDATKRYLSAMAIEEIERNQTQMQACTTDADRAFSRRQAALGVLIALWTYNMLDSAFAFEQNSPVEQHSDTHLNKGFYAEAKTNGLLFGVEFRF